MIDVGSLLAQADSGGGQADPGAAPQGGFWTDPSGTVRPWTPRVDPTLAQIYRTLRAVIPSSRPAFVPQPRPSYVPGAMPLHMAEFSPQSQPANPSGVLNPNPPTDPGGAFVRSLPASIMAAIARRQREAATRPRHINRGISLQEIHRAFGLEPTGIGLAGLHPGIGLREIHRGRGIIPREAIGP